MFIAALFIIAKTWKQPSGHQQMTGLKRCEMEYYSAIKKNEILSFAATWVDLENIMISKISQTQILYGITYMWNIRNNTNESIYKIETDSQT